MRLLKTIFTFLLFLAIFHPARALGEKVVWEELDWQVISGEHFDVYYPRGYDALGRLALVYAEEANIVLSKKLQHNLSQVIPVFVYPSHSHFQMTNIIFNRLDEGIGGFTERIKKRVVVPFMGTYDGFRHVMTHELVHAFQYDILLGGGFGGLLASQYAPNPPLWLIEGMAEYLSIQWDETADMTIRDAVITDTLPTLADMTEGRVMSGYMLYKGGQSVMRFIAETYGEKKIGELLKDLRDQKSAGDAIKTNFGIDFKEFDQNWRIWVKRQHYKFVEKRIDEEEAQLLSEHFEDQSFLNMHPALSPDGKKVAYLSIRDFFPAVVLRDAKPFKQELDYNVNAEPEERDEEILVRSSDNHEFYQLHLLDNRLSFTPDSKKLFFTVRSGGKDHLYLFDIKRKKVVKKYTPALDMIQYPRLSFDGKKAVFVGSLLGQPDVYLLDLGTRKLTQVTFDMFSEKDPSLSGDNKKILFSSNRNENKDLEHTNYHVFEFDIETEQVTQLTFARGKQVSPVYYYHQQNQRILYTSNQTGVYNAYIKDIGDDKPYQVTDTQGGVFEAQTDRKSEKLLFTMYRRQGYDIALRKAPSHPKDLIEEPVEMIEFKQPTFPIYPGGLSQSRPRSYGLKVSPDWFFFGFQYSSAFGFGGFAQVALSDYLGNHQVSGYIDYLSNRNALNFNIVYAYLKKRVNFYAGAFRAQNFFSIFNLTNLATINDFLYNPGFFVNSISRYGVYGTASYPFTPFWRLDTTVELSRLEQDFRSDVAENFRRPDIFTNLTTFRLGTQYNNVLYSVFGPLRGAHLSVSAEQTANISGRDLVFNQQVVDARYYMYLGNRYVIATRLFAANVSGPDSQFFPWQVGGFNTIRGYEFLEFQGEKAFVGTIEFRYPVIDAIAFGFPVPWVIRGFSGVFFFDVGTAFTDPSQFKGMANGRLQDLKLSFGLGTRFILFPGLMLKIDWATPWDFQEALPISKWQGVFSIGYEF